jgi:Transposase zinc-ribbon domain
MPKNRVQFQKGMSLAEFVERFGGEAQCKQALFEWRWPQGFWCPECGHEGGCWLESRKLLQCHRCHRQSSLTSGTIFAASAAGVVSGSRGWSSRARSRCPTTAPG